MAYSDINGSSVPVLVFDSASQLPYITDKTANPVAAQASQNILNTFGTCSYKTQACNVVK